MACYIYAYHDFWKKLSCSLGSVYRAATDGMDAGQVANSHGRLILQLGGSRNIFSEPLEQLASHNGADMYKYNMLYTFKINQHVLTPTSSYYIKKYSFFI